MDVCIAIAAAGAGYVAKHWQNLLKESGNASEFRSGDSKFLKPESPSCTGHPSDKNCALQRFLCRKRLGEDSFRAEEQAARSASVPEVASTSGSDGERLLDLDNYEDCNILSISSLSPRHMKNEEHQVVADRVGFDGNEGEIYGNSSPEPSSLEMGTYCFTRNRSCLRSRQSNMQFMKPLTSLESCLMAQLYKDHAVTPPSSPTVRPFFVTDGTRIISRGGNDAFYFQNEIRSKLHSEVCSADNETVVGLPPLPYARSLELPRMKIETGKGLGGKLSSSSKVVNRKIFSLAGSSHGALLFGLGVSVGLISSFLANKKEVDKLNDLLRQTENLVEDLQEELQMKDSLTVKELAVEDCESQDTCYRFCNERVTHASSSEQNMDGSSKYDGKDLSDQKEVSDSGSMSKIEAELEAELERLELNMKSSRLEGRLSDLDELDPDFIQGLTQGELRSDMFSRKVGQQHYADQDGSGTSTPHPANYAVSPRELSLRLHEVIQSRLAERVNELEIALENSQRKVRFMESERKGFSVGELRSSSYRAIPFGIEQRNAMDQPVVINLSGEALDAYNEGYDEFMKVNESEEADSRSRGKNHEKTLHPFDQDGQVNRCKPHFTAANGIASPSLISGKLRTLDEQILSEVGFIEAESGSDDDEMEKLLIMQIVEKTRKGSFVVSNDKL